MPFSFREIYSGYSRTEEIRDGILRGPMDRSRDSSRMTTRSAHGIHTPLLLVFWGRVRVVRPRPCSHRSVFAKLSVFDPSWSRSPYYTEPSIARRTEFRELTQWRGVFGRLLEQLIEQPSQVRPRNTDGVLLRSHPEDIAFHTIPVVARQRRVPRRITSYATRLYYFSASS